MVKAFLSVYDMAKLVDQASNSVIFSVDMDKINSMIFFFKLMEEDENII